MSDRADDSTRRVVPRWRPLRPAAHLESLGNPTGRPAIAVPVSEDELRELTRAWERHRTPLYAAGLVDAALIMHRPAVAISAAEFLREAEGVDRVAQAQAEQVLTGVGDGSEVPPQVTQHERYRRIAEYRQRLRREPRNPMLLVDLAREYSSLGQNRPAERALFSALALAPANRFVLRAAVRFFLHIRELEHAHDIVRRCPRTAEDPWLLAAELVAAEKAGRTSRLVRRGQQMVDGKKLHPRHTSELASALATLEMREGRSREARKRFRQSLIDPTENSLAQASWAARHLRNVGFPDGALEIPRAFEAGAWDAYSQGQEQRALDFAWNWLLDEPFATRPADFGAWIASVLAEDFERALTFADSALLANPHDVHMHLHRLFSLASLNRLEEAELVFGHISDALRGTSQDLLRERVSVFEAANRGLIAFRRRMPELGRSWYQKAIHLAESNEGLRDLPSMARLYQAQEELKAGEPVRALHLLQEAKRGMDAIDGVFRPAYREKAKRLENRAGLAPRQTSSK